MLAYDVIISKKRMTKLLGKKFHESSQKRTKTDSVYFLSWQEQWHLSIIVQIGNFCVNCMLS